MNRPSTAQTRTAMIAIAIVLIGLVLISIVSTIVYSKTIWDLLDLVIVPLTLVLVGYWFTSSQHHAQNEIARDNQRETALQEYFNNIATLIFEHDLMGSKPGDEVRAVARSLTMTTLAGLDGERKGALLLFLKETKLVLASQIDAPDQTHPIIHSDNIDLDNVKLTDSFIQRIQLPWAKIRNADFRYSKLNEAILEGVDLSGAKLTKTELMKANLREAKLIDADLQAAELFETDLQSADLSNANLSECNLYYARLQGANLSGAKLNGTNLRMAEYTDSTVVSDPNLFTKWPSGFDPVQAGAKPKTFNRSNNLANGYPIDES